MALVPREVAGLQLRITVLPKVWSNGPPARLCTTIDLDAAAKNPHDGLSVPVHEKQHVRLRGREEVVNAVANALVGLRFDDDCETDEERPKPVQLFARSLSRPDCDEKAQADRRDEVKAFWSLMTRFTDLLTIPMDDARRIDAGSYLAERLLRSVPELEPIVRRVFVAKAEAFVRRRRPEFRHHVDEMAAVRGRIVTSGLVRRAARGQQAVACEFDELDADSQWQRIIRFAARLVARNRPDGDVTLARRAARVDRLMADCHVLHAPAARQLCSQRGLAPPRKARYARQVLELARWLILARYPFGLVEAERTPPPALAVGVRVPTARLFERLLAGVTVEPCGTLEMNVEPVPIRARGSSGKRPDLVCRNADGRPILYADAKYKLIKSPHFGEMPMSDQYQQYAYAASTGITTVFIYVRRTPRGASDGTIDRAVVHGTTKGPRLAVTSVPFPSPQQCHDVAAWRLSTGKQLSHALRRRALR